MKLELVPISFPEANAFIEKHHRHNTAMQGCKFCVAVTDGTDIVGVAMAGRPVARLLDDGWTLEINRTCTDGQRNANSMLYGACLRAAWALGYKKVITYTHKCESGASLKAAGFSVVGEITGTSWNRQTRPRVDVYPLQNKFRWDVTLA